MHTLFSALKPARQPGGVVNPKLSLTYSCQFWYIVYTVGLHVRAVSVFEKKIPCGLLFFGVFLCETRFRRKFFFYAEKNTDTLEVKIQTREIFVFI